MSLDYDDRILQGIGGEWAAGRTVSRAVALQELARQGWDHAVRLDNVLDDALGHHDRYSATDVLIVCGVL